MKATQSTLSPYDRREVIAFCRALACHTLRSNQRGCENEEVHRKIGYYIKQLIRYGVFKKGTYLGRRGWCGNPNYKRVALNVPLLTVVAKREQIIHVLETKLDELYAEEVYNLIEVAVLNAATNGFLGLIQNVGLRKILEYAIRPGNWVYACQILNNEQAILNILGASEPELPKAVA